jgi:hypothetical protein
MSDNFTPKMDRAFALETIDAYPEDQPPTSSSDRFWFELAARFLAKDFITLERELAEARGELFDTEARYSASEDLRRQAEAALAALREQRCETCQHQRVETPDYSECALTLTDDWGCRTECRTLGGGCLAWARRET